MSAVARKQKKSQDKVLVALSDKCAVSVAKEIPSQAPTQPKTQDDVFLRRLLLRVEGDHGWTSNRGENEM